VSITTPAAPRPSQGEEKSMTTKSKAALIGLLTFNFAVVPMQWAQGDSVHAQFSTYGDADTFLVKAQNNGQGKGAKITHNPDGTTSVTLPDVATEHMSETAMDAIGEHSSSVVIGPQIPDEIHLAITIWFDWAQAEGITGIALTSFSDGFEYWGCVNSAAIGFDRSNGLGNVFFAYLYPFSVVANIEELDPNLEEPIKAAIEEEAVDRGIELWGVSCQ